MVMKTMAPPTMSPAIDPRSMNRTLPQGALLSACQLPENCEKRWGEDSNLCKRICSPSPRLSATPPKLNRMTPYAPPANIEDMSDTPQ